MKIYNPFKPHIVEQDGLFLIRKADLFGWRYLDKDDILWWTANEYVYEYCLFNDVLLAKLRIIEYKSINRKSKQKLILQ